VDTKDNHPRESFSTYELLGLATRTTGNFQHICQTYYLVHPEKGYLMVIERNNHTRDLVHMSSLYFQPGACIIKLFTDVINYAE
jgi:hypothetical protein